MRRTWRLLEPIAHGVAAAILAFSAMWLLRRFTGHGPAAQDRRRIVVIVFCVATGHTAGIAAGRDGEGLAIGAAAGILVAMILPHLVRGRAA